MKLLERFVEFRAPKAKRLRFLTAAVPLAKPLTTLVKGNVLLAGNAARVVPANSGAGIATALLTGGLAGDIAACYALGGEYEGRRVRSLELYEDIVKARLFPHLERAYKMKERAILKEDGMRRVFKLAKRLMWLHKLAPGLLERRLVKTFLYW